jgi:hypothetical protein
VRLRRDSGATEPMRVDAIEAGRICRARRGRLVELGSLEMRGGETNTEGTERTENLPTLSTGRQAWRPAHDQSPAVGYFENLKKNK